MLELQNITFHIGDEEDGIDLLKDITLKVGARHFMAIVGPSGCGKTTLLKTVAGINEHSEGSISWDGRDLEEDEDFDPSEVAYVPQFSIAYDQLTVWESVESAVRLRVSGLSADEIEDTVLTALAATGIADIEDRFVRVLSGGQRRRLALAMELVADPDLLLCDEVTSGLDPKSEREIVHLLHGLSRGGRKRVVANVTHSLSNLELYDSVLVLFAGQAVYHGPPRALKHYFSVESTEEIYPRLGKRSPDRWASSWNKHRGGYYEKLERAAQIEREEEEKAGALQDVNIHESPATIRLYEELDAAPTAEDDPDPEGIYDPAEEDGAQAFGTAPAPPAAPAPPGGSGEEHESAPTPGFLSQLSVLTGRRWKIFVRDRGQVFLHLAMLVGFPILVAVFALEGIEPLKKHSVSRDSNAATEFQRQQEVRLSQLEVGGLVSGLVMFQVVLLTLMGSNNSAREIAAERAIFEKEKFAGLSPGAYLASKVLFLSLLVLAQSFWMAAFVEMVTGGTIPGSFATRFLLLLLVNAAMTAICLGISSLMRTAEQASLMSIYLVGFQLPLSGAVLTLPQWLEPVVQPLISAFWAWSGSLSSMSNTDFYDAVKQVTSSDIVNPTTCLYVLLTHLAAGLVLATIGCRQNRWEH